MRTKRGESMRIRVVSLALCLLLAGLGAFGQVGSGTITGIVTDAQGAVVPGAAIEVRNGATNAVYTGASSATGNFSITQLPPGSYELIVKTQGFKTYDHKGLQVEVAQELRQDVPLEVGAANQSVTVTAEATLLRTESGDLATNVTVESLDDLPILGIGPFNSGSSGVRNPYGMLQLLPGLGDYTADYTMILNGLGGVGAPTEAFRVEGMDSTDHLPLYYNAVQQNQPSADAVQEVAIQTSNYAPEFGQAGAAVLIITMKSGTNQYHGSGYDYFVNEDLNAGVPFSISGGPGSTTGGDGGKYRPRNRRNDFGGTLGGPVVIPKLYNGHNKTFFFWNYEEYLETVQYSFGLTVPVPAYLNGNFSAISPNGTCSLCSQYGIQTSALGVPNPTTDALGRQIFANTIYDPLTRGVVASSNLGYANPFPNNMVPSSRFDPVAMKIEALFPAATNSNLTSNATGIIPGHRSTTIPSVKIDQVVTNKDKVSFYWSKTSTESQISSPNGDADGLPVEIGQYRGTFIYSNMFRLNYDRTITPTLLLHVGAGYSSLNFGDQAPFVSFNPSAFGLTGFEIDRQFPTVSGINAAGPGGATTSYGGMQTIGTDVQLQTHNDQEKPTFNTNATWVRGNHTYKLGAEMYIEGTVNTSFAGVTLATGVNATSQPFTPTVSLGSYGTGFGYASFLLGDYNSTTQTPQENYRLGKQQWGLYLQDSWKVMRKLTLDYGLRWDLGTAPAETYGRLGEFDPNTPDANAGGRLGATRYASTCNCSFYPQAYPYAIGPRVGAAYQITPKTVFRGGWGLLYQFTSFTNPAGIVSTSGANLPPGINSFVNIDLPGAILAPTWPVTNPNVYPAAGTLTGGPVNPDRNWARPPRINQWSAGFQREITRNFVIDAAYVANRAVWLSGGPGSFINQIAPSTYAQYGLYPYPGTGPAGYNNYADFQLLTQAVSATAVKQKLAAAGVPNGGLLLPFAGFPTSTALKTALYAYPQFSTLAAPSGIANGESRYDSLQMKATKRISHGLTAAGTFTWSRAFTLSSRQDFFNPQSSVWELQSTDIPLLLNANVVYTTPKAEFLNKFENAIVKDWQLGAFVQYESGALLAPPASITSNFLTSEEIRMPGVPLYLKNLNCGCFNPYYDQVLNPAAWQNVPVNGVGPASGTYYSDFRGPRHPQENFNIGRNFRFKEGKYNLQIRGEFVNIFNRLYFPSPSTAVNTTTALTKNSFGYYTAGFGVIDAYQTPNSGSIFAPTASGTAPGSIPLPRTGTLIARFSF
jgi:hypothetical protein